MLSVLLELQRLKRLDRTGWVLRGLPTGAESVAAHSYGVALTVMLLADEAKARGVEVTRVPCPGGVFSLPDFLRAIRPETRLVAMLHASNVTGARMRMSRRAWFCVSPSVFQFSQHAPNKE